MFAVLVSPTDPVAAARSLKAMMQFLNYPDAAFTPESAKYVCTSGRHKADGTLGPLNRVPTFGELDHALGNHWRKIRELAALQGRSVAREALPAPPPEPRDSAAMAHVRMIVDAFEAERSWHQPQTPSADRPPVEPRHLSDQQLLAVWEQAMQQGVPGAHVRVAALKAKLGL